jgi:acyl-coenzyme A synthetase/AMP-(fatty) acid ligase
VVAVLQIKHGESCVTPSAAELATLCRAQLESYKVPKRFMVCSDWPMTASGKTDHPALAALLQQPTEINPCLHTLP